MIARALPAVAAVLLVANLSTGGARAQAPAQKPAAQQPPAQVAKPVTPPPQAQPPAARPPATPPARSATASSARGAISLVVTDPVGKTIPDVRVYLTGAMSRDGTTSRDGGLTLEGLRPGTYRLRFEAAGFITLEREVAMRTGPAVEVDVALDRAPAKPVEPPPPAQPANSRAAIPVDPNAAVALLELPDWIQRNLIGRNDPQKEDSVGRTPVLTPTVLQVRDPTHQRGRDDADEILYVIAGEGVLRTGGRDQSLDAGSLAVIPRGVTYTLERRGRNPLIALSVVGK
jgi:mannose-6-phosphate isomerase-like protein (cupin superfamily)